LPQVPDYGQRKVGEEPLPGARQSGPAAAAETPASEGAAIGGALEQAGGVAFRVGAEQKQHADRRRDELFELNATRQATETADRLLRDPETGVLNARGLEVMKARETAEDQWHQASSDILKGATTPDQQLVAQRITDTYSARLRDAFNVHQDQQLRQYDDNEFKGLQASSQALVISSATTSPGAVTDTIADVSDQATKYAKRNGLGPEATQALVADVRNQLAGAAITETLTQGNPVLAKVYIDHYSEQGILTGEARAKLEEAVKRGLTDDAADTLAGELWTQYAPKSDTEPISIDKIEEAARARTKGDPDLMKATITALRERKAAADSGRAERLNQVQQTLWGGVLAGRSYGELAHTPEGAAHPEELLKVRDYLDSRAAADESRAYTRESRAAAAYDRQQRELEDKGWVRLYELSDPNTLSKMTDGDIMAQLPTLGHAHVNRLLVAKRELATSTTALSKANVDADLFRDNAYRAGFNYVYSDPSKLTGDQKIALGKLRAAVEDAVAAEQLSQRRPLTRDEVSAVQQKIMDRTVFLHNRVYADQEQAAAAVVNKDDQARAYVPINRIRDPQLTEWINLIRSTVPGAQQFTRDQILNRYTDRIQRAHAAAMMGLGQEEEQRRLLGQ
jgi:hypothetical protein